MNDVAIVGLIYLILFVVLTTPVMDGMGGLSYDTLSGLHYLISELVFWAGALYICASGTYGAFARQDRFGISRDYPFLNRVLSLLLLASPFLAVFVNVRFTYLMLGLLLFSHVRSRTEEEEGIDFTKSRTLSNSLLLMLFTLAMLLMNVNDYYVDSILDFGSLNNELETE